MLNTFPRILLFFSTLVILSSCTKGGSGKGIIQDKQVYTITDQMTIGDHLSTTIKSDAENFDLLNTNAYPDVTDYVNTLLNSAVISEHVITRADFTWEVFLLVDEVEAYAYSMPGGKVVLSTAMLKALQNESELLALMSNEIYFTDIDLHTEALKDEFSGIRMGSIALGNEDESSDLIQFLKSQSFSEEQVLEADKRTVAVLCPFNYDIHSLQSLVDRSYQTGDMSEWIFQRPRPENWEELMFVEIEMCGSDSEERFRSRYQEMIATLP